MGAHPPVVGRRAGARRRPGQNGPMALAMGSGGSDTGRRAASTLDPPETVVFVDPCAAGAGRQAKEFRVSTRCTSTRHRLGACLMRLSMSEIDSCGFGTVRSIPASSRPNVRPSSPGARYGPSALTTPLSFTFRRRTAGRQCASSGTRLRPPTSVASGWSGRKSIGLSGRTSERGSTRKCRLRRREGCARGHRSGRLPDRQYHCEGDVPACYCLSAVRVSPAASSGAGRAGGRITR